MNMTRVFILVTLIGAMQLPESVQALPVTGLYSHEIAVANQSEDERNRAFREALEAVLVKVTGEQRWLENSALRQALDNAQDYVEAINFRTEPRPPPLQQISDSNNAIIDASAAASGPRQFYTVSFARSLVDRLLANAAIPVWDSNRPSVLVWMALQSDVGERSLLSVETNSDLIDLISEFAAKRGVPVIFPVLDFEDRRNLSADQIWTLDENAIRTASQRYGADSILSGRLHLTASGDLVGLWQFLFQDQVDIFDGFDTSLQSYVEAPLDRVTSQLARHFAVVVSQDGNQKTRVRVAGVDNLTAYSSLVSYLQSLSMVESVLVSSVQAESLELELTLRGSPQQLNELISLDRDLLPVNLGLNVGQNLLSYRWTR